MHCTALMGGGSGVTGGNGLDEDRAWIQSQCMTALATLSLWNNVSNSLNEMTGNVASLDGNGRIASQGTVTPATSSVPSSREAYQGSNTAGNSNYVRKSTINIDGGKGGLISNYDDFYNFMVDQANLNPVEVGAWKLYDKENSTEMYFVLPWDRNKSNETDFSPDFFGDAGYAWSSFQALGDYHTHPHSTGPSYADVIHKQANPYPSYVIGADGKVWNVFNPIGIPALYIDMPGMNPNVYRYGDVIYKPNNQ